MKTFVGDHETMLRGFTVGITADRRWEEQAMLFERRGATIMHAPTIRTLPLGSPDQLEQSLQSLIATPPDAFVANTGLGVRSLFSAADDRGLGDALRDALARVRMYARGPKAGAAIRGLGYNVVAQADSERLAEVAEQLIADLDFGSHIAVQVDGSGDATTIDVLRDAGFFVSAVSVYEWTLPTDHRPAVRLAEQVIAGRIDAITFTSRPAVENWVLILDAHDLAGALRSSIALGTTVVGCVGPVCADAAIRAGFNAPTFVTPDAYRLAPLVRSVSDALTATAVRITIGHSDLELAGTTLVVAGSQPVDLPIAQARILRCLAMRPNSVVSRQELLATTWPVGRVAGHAIETAIARLRTQLGPLAPALIAVPRRGYTLRCEPLHDRKMATS